MPEFDPTARLLAIRLGVGDLNRPPVCSGYEHSCQCEECVARAEQASPDFLAWLERDDDLEPVPALYRAKHVPQPWLVRRVA